MEDKMSLDINNDWTITQTLSLYSLQQGDSFRFNVEIDIYNIILNNLEETFNTFCVTNDGKKYEQKLYINGILKFILKTK